jgi:hypothetical protein
VSAVITCPSCGRQLAVVGAGRTNCPCGQSIEVAVLPPPLPVRPPPIYHTAPVPVPIVGRKQTSNAALTVAILGIAFVGLLGFLAYYGSDYNPPGAAARQPTSDYDIVEMQVKAERAVKQRLKAPSTAKFPGMFEQSAYRISKTTNGYILKGWVDAQNGFGAMIRNDWYVEFLRRANGEFEIGRVEINSP